MIWEQGSARGYGLIKMAEGEHKYAESAILNGIRDMIRLIVLALIFWTATTLNNVDKDTTVLKHRMERIETRVYSLETNLERERREKREDQ